MTVVNCPDCGRTINAFVNAHCPKCKTDLEVCE